MTAWTSRHFVPHGFVCLGKGRRNGCRSKRTRSPSGRASGKQCRAELNGRALFSSASFLAGFVCQCLCAASFSSATGRYRLELPRLPDVVVCRVVPASNSSAAANVPNSKSFLPERDRPGADPFASPGHQGSCCHQQADHTDFPFHGGSVEFDCKAQESFRMRHAVLKCWSRSPGWQ